MKKILLISLVSVLTLNTYRSFSQNVIHSTFNGGLWTDPGTWIEAIPSTGDSVVIQGPVSLLSYTGHCTTLNIVTTGSLGGNGNQGTLYIGGSIHNSGAILGTINYVLSGNIYNYQPWTGISSSIKFIGQDHTINCSPGASINAQFIADDSLQNLTMLSDLVLNTTQASVLGFSQLETSGHKLTIASGEFSNCRLHSTDTIEINSNVSTLEITGDYKLTGNMTFYYDMVFYENATNYGTISFASGVGGGPLKIKGDFINKGTMNHSWVQVEKNISNEGSWVSARTDFVGTGDKHISQTDGHPFGGGQITSDNSGSVIYLDSDIEFTVPQVFLNNNILNCGNHILTANSTFDNGIIHTEAEIRGNSDFWTSIFTGNLKLSGNNRFSNCTVDGILTNTGMMKDITYYGGTFNSHQHLINYNSIQSLHLKIYGNLTNYGTINNNSIIDVTGNITQYINMTQSIESQVNFYSDISGVTYQWMKDGQDILNANNVFLPFTSLQLSDAGIYKCRVTDGSGGTSYSRDIIVNETTLLPKIQAGGLNVNVYPNPFTEGATISWQLPEKTHVELIIYDFTGKEIKTLADEEMLPGEHQIVYNANGLKTGLYFLQLKTNDTAETRKMIFTK